MKKKEAKELDAILSVFTPNAWIAKASEEEWDIFTGSLLRRK